MPCPSSANTAAHSAVRGRGAACESRCSAIHPEIPQRGIEGLRPSLPGLQHLHGVVFAVILNPRKRVKELSSNFRLADPACSAATPAPRLSTVNSQLLTPSPSLAHPAAKSHFATRPCSRTS